MNTQRLATCFWLFGLLVASGCASVKSYIHEHTADGDCETCSEHPMCNCAVPGSTCAAPAGCMAPGANIPPSGYMNDYGTQPPMQGMMPQPIPHSEMQSAVVPNSYEYGSGAVKAASYQEGWGARSSHLPPSTPTNPSTVCDAHLQNLRSELDQKVAVLNAQIESQKAMKESLNESVSEMRSELTRLSKEARVAREEIRRIDRASEMQHRSEQEALNKLLDLADELDPHDAANVYRNNR